MIKYDEVWLGASHFLSNMSFQDDFKTFQSKDAW